MVKNQVLNLACGDNPLGPGKPEEHFLCQILRLVRGATKMSQDADEPDADTWSPTLETLHRRLLRTRSINRNIRVLDRVGLAGLANLHGGRIRQLQDNGEWRWNASEWVTQ